MQLLPERLAVTCILLPAVSIFFIKSRIISSQRLKSGHLSYTKVQHQVVVYGNNWDTKSVGDTLKFDDAKPVVHSSFVNYDRRTTDI